MPPVPEEDPIVLPPVSLASEDELRRAAAAAPLVVRVGALLFHLGPEGRPTTQTDALRLGDAKEGAWSGSVGGSSHPFTEPVLQALAASAPPVVSKAARKALFSLRSARH